jgi:hypothetical protein
MREWTTEPIKKLKTYDMPNVTSGIKIKTNGATVGKNFSNALGYFYSDSNNINTSSTNVAMFSSPAARGHGFGVNIDNFDRCVAAFATRKLIMPDWINSKDEYLVPNTEHPDYEEFVNDSVIFSLFHSASNQSSLRNVEYKDKTWEIKNEFFWMSREEIMDLADENDNEECYEDAVNSKERFVYEYLKNVTLSPEAQAVLDAANNLVRETFKYRNDYNIERPDYQINNWDCGYYQQKGLWNLYMKDEFD